MFPSFETGLTKTLNRMGVEHFVASPTKPDSYKKDEKQRIHKDIRTDGQSNRKAQKTKYMIDIKIEQNGEGAFCGKPH